MTDEQRETLIQATGERMEAAWARWETSELISDYLEAQRLLRERDDLVRGRSKAQVAGMEQARGLARA